VKRGTFELMQRMMFGQIGPGNTGDKTADPTLGAAVQYELVTYSQQL